MVSTKAVAKVEQDEAAQGDVEEHQDQQEVLQPSRRRRRPRSQNGRAPSPSGIVAAAGPTAHVRDAEDVEDVNEYTTDAQGDDMAYQLTRAQEQNMEGLELIYVHACIHAHVHACTLYICVCRSSYHAGIHVPVA